MTAEIVAKALGGRKVGDGWIARCPAHCDRDPSLSVRDAKDGKILVHCHAGCQQTVLIAELRNRGLWHQTRGCLQESASAPLSSGPPDSSALNRGRAAALWQEATLIAGTIAARYLTSRRVFPLAAEFDGLVLRFHPSCPYGGSRHPCLLALMRDLFSNEPQAIQRTALTSTGQKIGRRSLGRTSSSAIKLSPDEDVASGLVIGEGLETVLSAVSMDFRPAWALGDAGSVRNFPVFSSIECLTIIVDNDENGIGQQAAVGCSTRWTSAGREVTRIIPNQRGHDMNNVLQRAQA